MTSDVRIPKVRVAGRWHVDALAYATASIARGLRGLRLRAGLTQAEVARRARIRVETLSRVENGRANPTVRTVRKIVRAIERAKRPVVTRTTRA